MLDDSITHQRYICAGELVDFDLQTRRRRHTNEGREADYRRRHFNRVHEGCGAYPRKQRAHLTGNAEFRAGPPPYFLAAAVEEHAIRASALHPA
jgi:hypothetical protein